MSPTPFKFKTGDIVRCITPDNPLEVSSGGSGWAPDKKYIVWKCEHTACGNCYFPKRGSGVFEEWLEHNRITNWRKKIEVVK